MKKLIALFIALSPFAANAECWEVSNLKGQSQFSPEYKTQKDEATETYHISITGKTASLKSVGGAYESGLTYSPVSSTSMVGASHGQGSAFIEIWAITPDGKVLYTKTRSSPSHWSQLSSFIGDVIGKC
ncbi:hypothetical protein [Xenorhabdus bovienii]|uniref:hypothetical protein n=1 Tax=Xenorhabdus bovienii TaxID=40576 RepID=UPI00237C9027|nr:hypothetical protein [Xenorhabdus bovienii]MDE1493065.1 hypothetical protein [Xenorhabdus bovienii]